MHQLKNLYEISQDYKIPPTRDLTDFIWIHKIELKAFIKCYEILQCYFLLMTETLSRETPKFFFEILLFLINFYSTYFLNYFKEYSVIKHYFPFW